MRVFLDACVDPRAAKMFVAHEVRTAFELDWHKLKDHVLLSRVQGHYDVVGCLTDLGVGCEARLWGSQSWLPSAFSRRRAAD